MCGGETASVRGDQRDVVVARSDYAAERTVDDRDRTVEHVDLVNAALAWNEANRATTYRTEHGRQS